MMLRRKSEDHFSVSIANLVIQKPTAMQSGVNNNVIIVYFFYDYTCAER